MPCSVSRREGGRVEGHYTVPLGVHFPASLMAEAVGQVLEGIFRKMKSIS